MPRYRTIKPEHWSDDALTTISLQAELFWIGTWNFSDDEGIFEDDPYLLRSQIFPRRKEIRIEEIIKWLDQLVKARYIVPFSHAGRGYYITRSFKAHQRIDKPQPSKIPSEIIRGVLQDHSQNVPRSLYPESRIIESSVKESSNGAPPAPREPSGFENNAGKGKFKPPESKEVVAYFIQVIGNTEQPNHWPEDKCRYQAGKMFDHYTTNGWVQGKGKPIKDWRAACRTWIRNCIEGVFDKPVPAKKDEPPQRSDVEDKGTSLKPIQQELNYLYGSWLENEDRVTVISITVDHYNFLKSARMIGFSEEEAAAIRKKALDHMAEKKLEGEIALTRLMKAYGVLEFFKQYKAQGKETVFVHGQS